MGFTVPSAIALALERMISQIAGALLFSLLFSVFLLLSLLREQFVRRPTQARMGH